MKKATFSILLLTFLSIFGKGYSQTLPTIIEPTPKAKAFQKLGDYGVDYSSGIPAISIPLYTIQVDGVSMPFSLAYQNNGFKPLIHTQASEAGMGWVVDGGGMVSRTVKGAPDEGYATYTGNINSLDQEVESDFLLIRDLYNMRTQNGGYNTEYDIFQYRFSGHNGSFIIEYESTTGNFKAVELKGSTNKIEIATQVPLPNTPGMQGFLKVINGFTITTEDGTVYKFGFSDRDVANVTGADNVFQWQVPTTWMLEEIIPPNSQNKITLEYIAGNSLGESSGGSSKSVTNVVGMLPIGEEIKDRLQGFSEDDANASFLNSMSGGCISNGSSYSLIQYAKILSRVVFPNGTIEFSYSPDKTFLNSLSVKNSSNEVIKNYNLVRKSSDLLLLESLEETATGLPSSVYSFNYYTDPLSLPYTAFHRDPFGYASGNYPGLSDCRKFSVDFTQGNYFLNHPSFNNQYWFTIGDIPMTSNLDCTKIGVLSSIKYPTGGETKFDYELNQYTNFGVLTEGGGLRIKNIINYLGGIEASRKSYKYNVGEIDFPYGEQGVAAQLPFSSSVTNVYRGSELYSPDNSNIVFVNSRTLSDTFSSELGENRVRYSNVREYQGTEFINNGSTQYEYDLISRMGRMAEFDNFSVAKIFRSKINDWKDGLLKKQTIYDKNNNPVQTIVNNYTFKEGTTYFNSRIFRLSHYMLYAATYNDVDEWIARKPILNGGVLGTSPDLPHIYGYYQYEIAAGGYYLSNQVTTTINNGTNIVSSTDYVYESTDWTHPQRIDWLPKQIITTSSTGDTKIKEFVRPYNLASEPYITMVSRNNIGAVVEEKEIVNGAFKQSIKNNYKSWSPLVIAPEIVQSYSEGFGYSNRIQYKKYNEYGKPTEVSNVSGPSISYVWGYKGQYPVAEIKNADYTAVENILGGWSNVDNFNTSNPTETQVNSFLAQLKIQLPNAQVNTFTYKPLVGMTSQTDAKGMTTYYEYDSFQRLKAVKNHNGEILKTYCYNYAGQLTDCNSSAGGTTQASPSLVYARVEVENSSTSPTSDGSSTDADFYVALYSDANCTQPVSLRQSLDVNVGASSSAYENNSYSSLSWTDTYTVPANTNRQYIGRFTTDWWYSYYDPYYEQIINSYYYYYQVEDNGLNNYIPAATY